MKKPFFAVLLAALAAQTGGSAFSLLTRGSLQEYSSQFLSKNTGLITGKYVRAISDDDYRKIAPLGGESGLIDTPLEIAVLSFSAGVVDIRPAEAAEMLPKGRESLLKVGALIYQNLQVATFLRSSNAAALAIVFNQFCVDNGASEAEIKAYFDRNIGTAIAAEVDAQFNKVSFMIDRNYNAVLTRNPQTGQYKLSYEGVGHVTNELPVVSSLEALSSEMSKSGDFSATAFNEVRAQAALIPAVKLNSGALDDIKRIVTTFYTNPTAGTYNAVKEVYALYTDARLTTGEAIFEKTRLGYVAALTILNESLARKVIADAEKQGTYTSLTREQQQRFITLR